MGMYVIQASFHGCISAQKRTEELPVKRESDTFSRAECSQRPLRTHFLLIVVFVHTTHLVKCFSHGGFVALFLITYFAHKKRLENWLVRPFGQFSCIGSQSASAATFILLFMVNFV